MQWLIPKKFLSLRIKMFAQAKLRDFFPEGTVVMKSYSSIKALFMRLPCQRFFFSPDAWCRPQADRSATDGTSPK